MTDKPLSEQLEIIPCGDGGLGKIVPDEGEEVMSPELHWLLYSDTPEAVRLRLALGIVK